MNIVTLIIYAVLVIGALAFITSGITQLTKGIGFLSKIPTKFQVLVLGIALSLIFYFAYASYAGLAIVWYFIVGAVLLGVVVALVASDGWTYTISMLKRFINTDILADITDTVNKITGKDDKK